MALKKCMCHFKVFTIAHGVDDGIDISDKCCERRLWHFDGPVACCKYPRECKTGTAFASLQ